jgi:hypothetical protein
VGSGVQLGPLVTSATNRPIVPAPGDYDGGEIGGMIGRGNRSTWRKPDSVPLCPPQTPHAARTRTRAAAVGSQRLTAELRHGLVLVFILVFVFPLVVLSVLYPRIYAAWYSLYGKLIRLTLWLTVATSGQNDWRVACHWFIRGLCFNPPANSCSFASSKFRPT